MISKQWLCYQKFIYILLVITVVSLCAVSSTYANSGVLLGDAGAGTDIMVLGRLEVQGDTPWVAFFANNTPRTPSSDRSTLLTIANINTTQDYWNLAVGGTNNGLGINNGQFYFESQGYGVPVAIDKLGDITLQTYSSAGTTSTACSLLHGSSGWSCTSDRNMKQNFSDVDGGEILKLLNAMPVSKWSMKGSDIPHIGPVAQDFYAAFHLGANEKEIGMADAQGVALAAIKGLYEMNNESRKEISAQREKINAMSTALSEKDAQLQELKKLIAELSGRIKAIEHAGR
jgi:hypothetical protein